MISLTFFITSKTAQLYCAPVNAGPLDELYANRQSSHGYPFIYYREAIPSNCSFLGVHDLNDANKSSGININAFIFNTLFWSAIIFLIQMAITKVKKRR